MWKGPVLLAVIAALVGFGHAQCPFEVSSHALSESLDVQALGSVDIDAVKADLKVLMTTSQDWWPADFPEAGGHYGPLMIRLAWHCGGSYRNWDGRGGCDGARIRFFPEESWPDNTNLDKARRLLAPIKAKYGAGLSWGDLIVLAGNTAIESMGGPVLGFCAGRADDVDGTASLPLGPSVEQEAIAPCTAGQGHCEAPLGPNVVGLIYVNPEGVLGYPDPENTVPRIRSTFSRMGMDDAMTVALIGGGHATGKAHGACKTGPGASPSEDPTNPWPGTCGQGPLRGKGPNTFTSGFEGPWSTTPTKWSNEYFKNLLEYDWEVHRGPGGHFQWRPLFKPDAVQDHELPKIMMLTSDIALLHDPSYLQLVKSFAADEAAFNEVFSQAWYKLMTRDMGPASRCLGTAVPPPQPWQRPLPPPPATQPSWASVRSDILSILYTPSPAIAPDSTGVAGSVSYTALFATLAWQCASTYRQTDHFGGCNGARIRFSPQKDWPVNKGLDKVLEVLQPIKAKYPDLTYADLIVLAGTLAVEAAAGKIPGDFGFCPGRSDATEAELPMDFLAPRTYFKLETKVRDNFVVLGLTPAEGVALAARPRSPSHQQLLGYSGSWSLDNPTVLTNDFFKVLLTHIWSPVTSAAGREEYVTQVNGKKLYITPEDLVLRSDPQFGVIARDFAINPDRFLSTFQSAWIKVMNADRFDGPAGNVCDGAVPLPVL